MEEPRCSISCGGDEVAIRKSVVEQIFRGLMNALPPGVRAIQPDARDTRAEPEEHPEAFGDGLTRAEKIDALESLNRSMRLGMVDFDWSELCTHGRVTIRRRSAEILKFRPTGHPAKET